MTKKRSNVIIVILDEVSSLIVATQTGRKAQKTTGAKVGGFLYAIIKLVTNCDSTLKGGNNGRTTMLVL